MSFGGAMVSGESGRVVEGGDSARGSGEYRWFLIARKAQARKQERLVRKCTILSILTVKRFVTLALA